MASDQPLIVPGDRDSVVAALRGLGRPSEQSIGRADPLRPSDAFGFGGTSAPAPQPSANPGPSAPTASAPPSSRTEAAMGGSSLVGPASIAAPRASASDLKDPLVDAKEAQKEVDMSREALLRDTLNSIQMDPGISPNIQNVSTVLSQLLASVNNRLDALRTADGYSYERAKAEQQTAAIIELKRMYKDYIRQQNEGLGPLLVNGVLENRTPQFQNMLTAVARHFFTDSERSTLSMLLDKPFARCTFSTVEAAQLVSQNLYTPAQLSGVGGGAGEDFAFLQFYDFARSLELFYNEVNGVQKHALVRNRVATDKINYLRRLTPSVDDTPWEFVPGVARGFRAPTTAPRAFSLYPRSSLIFDPNGTVLDSNDPSLASRYPQAGTMRGFRAKTPYEVACDEAKGLSYKFANTNVALGQGLFKVRYTHGLAFQLLRGDEGKTPYTSTHRAPIGLDRWINTFAPLAHNNEEATCTWAPYYGQEDALHPCDVRIDKYPLNHFSYLASQYLAGDSRRFDTTGSAMGKWTEARTDRPSTLTTPCTLKFDPHGVEHTSAGAILSRAGFAAMPKYWVGFADQGKAATTAAKFPDSEKAAVAAAISESGARARPHNVYEIDSGRRFDTMRRMQERGNPIWACPRLSAAYNKAGVSVLLAGMIGDAVSSAVQEVLRTRNWSERVIDYTTMKESATQVRIGGLTSCEFGKVPIFYDRDGKILQWSEALIKGPDGNLYVSPQVDPDQTSCTAQTLAPYVPGITNREQFVHLMRNAGNPAFQASDANLRDLLRKESTSWENMKDPSGTRSGDAQRAVVRQFVSDLRSELGLPPRQEYNPSSLNPGPGSNPSKSGPAAPFSPFPPFGSTLPPATAPAAAPAPAPAPAPVPAPVPAAAPAPVPAPVAAAHGSLEEQYTRPWDRNDNPYYISTAPLLGAGVRGLLLYMQFNDAAIVAARLLNSKIDPKNPDGDQALRRLLPFVVIENGIITALSGRQPEAQIAVNGAVAAAGKRDGNGFTKPLQHVQNYEILRGIEKTSEQLERCVHQSGAKYSYDDVVHHVPQIHAVGNSFSQLCKFQPSKLWLSGGRLEDHIQVVSDAVQWFTVNISLPNLVDQSPAANWHRQIWGRIAGEFVASVSESAQINDLALALIAEHYTDVHLKQLRRLYATTGEPPADAFHRLVILFLHSFYSAGAGYRDQFINPARHGLPLLDYHTPSHTALVDLGDKIADLYNAIVDPGAKISDESRAKIDPWLRGKSDAETALFSSTLEPANVTGLHFESIRGVFTQLGIDANAINQLFTNNRSRQTLLAALEEKYPTVAGVVVDLFYDDSGARRLFYEKTPGVAAALVEAARFTPGVVIRKVVDQKHDGPLTQQDREDTTKAAFEADAGVTLVSYINPDARQAVATALPKGAKTDTADLRPAAAESRPWENALSARAHLVSSRSASGPLDWDLLLDVFDSVLGEVQDTDEARTLVLCKGYSALLLVYSEYAKARKQDAAAILRPLNVGTENTDNVELVDFRTDMATAQRLALLTAKDVDVKHSGSARKEFERAVVRRLLRVLQRTPAAVRDSKSPLHLIEDMTAKSIDAPAPVGKYVSDRPLADTAQVVSAPKPHK